MSRLQLDPKSAIYREYSLTKAIIKWIFQGMLSSLKKNVGHEYQKTRFRDMPATFENFRIIKWIALLSE